MINILSRILDIFDRLRPRHITIKTDKEAMQEDHDAIKKDWESVIGKDDGKNPLWRTK